MHSVSRALVCAAAACFVCLVLSAQESAPKTPAVTIKTGAAEVDLDLVVRDAKGKIVRNVAADQLQIFDDGKRQQIKSLRFFAAKEHAKAAEAHAAPTQPDSEASVLATPNLICLVFQGLDPYTKKNATDAAAEFLKTQQQPNTLIATFALSNNLVPLHEFTADRAELIKSISGVPTGPAMDFNQVANAVLNASPNMETIETTVQGDPSKGGTVSATMNIAGGDLNTRAINGAEQSTGIGASRLRGDLAGQRRLFSNIAGKQSLDELKLLIGQLAILPGHKTVLLLSAGLSNDTDPEHFDAILKQANKSGVTFYALDVNGLTQNSNALAVNTQVGHAASLSASQAGLSNSAAQNMEKMRQDDYLVNAVRNTDTQATMRALAEGTGGFLIGNTNDLRKPFAHMLEDLNTHYEAIYSPGDVKYDGRLRTIEIKTTRPDWTVESRTGYYAMPALNGSTQLSAADMMGLAALNVKKTPRAFSFGSAALQFRPLTNGSQTAVAFAMPASNLVAVPEENGKQYRMHVSVLTLVKNADGDVVDKFTQDAPFNVPADKVTAAQKSTLNFVHTFNLPPGTYTVEMAATDQEAERASVSRMPLVSPETKSVELSSITLVQRLEAVDRPADINDPFEVPLDKSHTRRVVPDLDRALSGTAKPYVYFVVYPDRTNPEKPKIQIEFLANDQLVAKQIAELPAPNSAGAIPMLVSAVTKPGTCVLRITALQGSESSSKTLAYSVAP